MADHIQTVARSLSSTDSRRKFEIVYGHNGKPYEDKHGPRCISRGDWLGEDDGLPEEEDEDGIIVRP